jgi:hypothetical protein
MARRSKGPILTKDERLLGVDTCREMEAMSNEGLENVIVQANSSIKQAKDELEKNPNYQEVKGKIAYALKLREQQGK